MYVLFVCTYVYSINMRYITIPAETYYICVAPHIELKQLTKVNRCGCITNVCGSDLDELSTPTRQSTSAKFTLINIGSRVACKKCFF